MPLWRTANKLFLFQRRTNILLDAEEVSLSTAHTLTRSMGYSGLLEITIASTNGNTYVLSWSGTVTDEAGPSSSVSESITITGDKTVTSKKPINIVSSGISIAVSGSPAAATPTIEVRAVHTDGSSMEILYTVADDRPAVISYMQMRGAADYTAETYGSQEADWAKLILSFETTWTPRVGDIVTDKHKVTEKWVIRAVRPVDIGYGYMTQHYEIRCTRIDT